MADETKKTGLLARLASLPLKAKIAYGACAGLVAAAGIGAAVMGLGGPKTPAADEAGVEKIAAFWPDAFDAKPYEEPPFEDDENRTNNAFNVMDFGEQGTNGWFYRYGKSKAPWRSERISSFNGEAYFQPGCNGLELKKNFVHTSEAASPILEWRAADDGNVNVTVTYVKNVNGDANPSYPDGVQLQIYKGEELLQLQNVDISVTEENLAQIKIENLAVQELESLYFVVDKRSNNAYDGGSLYVAISDVNAKGPDITADKSRKDNNANSQKDFGKQGNNGWTYMFGNTPADLDYVSHEVEGEFINATSPNLSISQYFIHPAINDNAVLAWTPARNGAVDLRVKYKKFEQHDGNPDFPDGVKVKVYKNDKLLYEQHVDAPAEGENAISFREAKLDVKTSDKLYFMVDPEGNSSYDGGAFDISIIDVTGLKDESAVKIDESETRQNVADVMADFGEQGANGFIYQFGYEDDPFNAYNLTAFDKKEDRYFEPNYIEIKRDYVNPGENGRSPIIKWKVAQNGNIQIKASYTKMKNEDKNPAWPDGTRVSLYHNGKLLKQETFGAVVGKEVTKRLDVSSLNVKRGDYITMVINGLDNTAYDGGKYEFSIMSNSGLVGKTEKTNPPAGNRENFASTMDDFGKQGNNGWYYQFGYKLDPFFAVNVEKLENNERYIMNDYLEIKRDYIVPANKGKSANVKWIVAKDGSINIDLQYTKLKNEDSNPSWPDGVTVYLMKNKEVLKKQYFAPLTNKEMTGDLSMANVKVKKGDAITMLVDPGKNNAYDGGTYRFVIEDAALTPTVKVGSNDNNTALSELSSIKQGTDGWWFLEGNSPADAKVLTKMNADQTAYLSRRSEALEMKKDYVHTGSNTDPIYLFVVGEDGNVDIAGTYVKFGQQDANKNFPDGVTLKIWHNGKNILSKKVKVLYGDGNNNAASFEFNKYAVKRGDKLYFQICRDSNFAWDAGSLSVAIEKSSALVRKPGNDNNSVLANIAGVEQGTDGWYFLEGTSVANAKPLSHLTADKCGYVSSKDSGLEIKKDYVHPGTIQSPIYQWVAAEDGKLDIRGDYVKFGQNDGNPSYPDGITLTIYQNGKQLYQKKVAALKGDGNDNKVEFNFKQLDVKKSDVFSFMISPDGNNAWDAGRLSVIIGDENKAQPEVKPDDDYVEDANRTNSTNLKNAFGKQGSDGWFYGACEWNGADFTKLPYDEANHRYYNNGKPELKADFVEPGARNAAYKWVAAKAGTIEVKGDYTKFANSEDPNANGTCMRIFLNGKEMKWMGTQGNFSEEKSVSFDETYTVHAGDSIIFAIDSDGNDSWDGGRLSVTISPKKAEETKPEETTPEETKPEETTPEETKPEETTPEETKPEETTPEETKPEETTPEETKPARSNNTNLKASFGKQGNDGWYYGMCDWDSKNYSNLPYDADGNRYYNNGKPELKADFVEPGNWRNAAYKWVVAQDGKINVSGDYVKFANSDDPNADGTCVRIFLNGKEVKWMGTIGNFSSEQKVEFNEFYDVKAGDELIFAINPENNDSWDGGRLSVTIKAVN